MSDESLSGPMFGRQLHGVMPRRKKTASPAETLETARYIAEMSAQLAEMASAADFGLLAYFLDMARIEGELAAQSGPPNASANSASWPPEG